MPFYVAAGSPYLNLSSMSSMANIVGGITMLSVAGAVGYMYKRN